MGDGAAHHLQNRAGPLQIAGLTAHQHRQRAEACAFGAAGHRGIQPAQAALGCLSRQPLRAGRINGGEINNQATGLSPRQESRRPLQNSLHSRCIGEAERMDLG